VTAVDERPVTGTTAEALVARLAQAMPDDIVVWRYTTSGGYVTGQLLAGLYADSSARLMRTARQFGLDYVETRDEYSPSRLDLSARGVIDGVTVRFWDNVPLPASAASVCSCGCHRPAVTS
jgi:hypothetical protein